MANNLPQDFNLQKDAKFKINDVAFAEWDAAAGTVKLTGDIVGGTGTVGTSELADLAVTTAKINADAVTNAKIADGAVSLEHLDSGVAPSHVAKFGGTFTTAGGDAAETITAAGVVATDIVVVTVKTAGVTPRSVVAAAAGTDQIDVTMSGDPSTDHVLQYAVFRAAA